MRRKMTGQDFEAHCARLLRKKGYRRVTLTKGSGDQGADILARRRGKTYAVQCKLYQKPVGNAAVQEAYAGQQYYGCDRSMVMTNSTFTKSARELAERTDVRLWDGIRIRSNKARRILFGLLLLGALAVAMYYTVQTVV